MRQNKSLELRAGSQDQLVVLEVKIMLEIQRHEKQRERRSYEYL